MKFKFASVLVVAAIMIGGGAAAAVASTTGHPRIIDFRSGAAKQYSLDISRPAMVGKLKGTSPAFKRFVAAQVRSMMNDRTCTDSAHTLSVYKYATNGYAAGGVTNCGGYAAIWGVRHSVWKQLIGTQDVFHCGQLHRNHVPVGLLNDGKCYIPGHTRLVTYRG